MKILKWMLGTMCLCGMISCSDDNGRDDTILEMHRLTGKYWYCTNWANNKEGYTTDDLLEILKFGEDGKLWRMDFGGKIDEVVGSWTSDNNVITLNYTESGEEKWNVLHSGEDYLHVKVNKGERNFVLEPRYLQNLAADAFLIQEISKTEEVPLRVGVEITGANTVNIGDAEVILAKGQVVPMVYKSRTKSWNARDVIEANHLGLPGEERLVVFYINAGGNPVKLSERIYAGEVPSKSFDAFQLNAINKGQVLEVSWNAFAQAGIYYRVEVLNGNMDTSNPYFVSVLYDNISTLSITKDTKTNNDLPNRMGELKNGMNYVVRLSAIVLEPGMDYNHKYSYTNLQSVTFVKRAFVWED